MISIFGQFSGNGLGYFNTVIYVSTTTMERLVAVVRGGRVAEEFARLL